MARFGCHATASAGACGRSAGRSWSRLGRAAGLEDVAGICDCDPRLATAHWPVLARRLTNRRGRYSATDAIKAITTITPIAMPIIVST
jgi:hypothetical protein